MAGAVAAAMPVTLKASPVDVDGRITLSELFDGTTSQAMVGSRTGSAAVLDAARVQALARANGLTWANPTGLRRITVTGAASPVASTAASTPAPTGAVEALTYVRSLTAGAIVTAEDVAWTPVVRASLDGPADAEAAIGLAVRKPVRAGMAVSTRDLVAARVIARNDPVSVHYRVGGINLSMQGKALSAAGVGEPVRVQNPQSRTIVDAVAAAPGLAVVGPQADALRARSSPSR